MAIQETELTIDTSRLKVGHYILSHTEFKGISSEPFRLKITGIKEEDGQKVFHLAELRPANMQYLSGVSRPGHKIPELNLAIGRSGVLVFDEVLSNRKKS